MESLNQKQMYTFYKGKNFHFDKTPFTSEGWFDTTAAWCIKTDTHQARFYLKDGPAQVMLLSESYANRFLSLKT